jgi:homocitrate synthase
MIVEDRDYVKSKYQLHKLKDIENLVAEAVQINVPFNNYVTGYCAFTASIIWPEGRKHANIRQHKAGIHAKAILANPSTYEILDPADFGLTRYVHFASRITGWHAIQSRVEQLGLKMTEVQVKQL